ncbi:MAG: hypothetical protein MRZ23_03530 [Finegoldia magna]|nr:hypothetical protein [Finegoldia magna]
MDITNKKFFRGLLTLIFIAVISTACGSKKEVKLTNEQKTYVGNYFDRAFKGIEVGKDRKLTDNEIKQIKKVFVEKLPSSEHYAIKNITSNFFRAGSYTNPKEMDLDAFVSYFPNKNLEENTSEFKTTIKKLEKLDNFSEFESSSKIMPLVKIDKNLVDATLQKYADIESDDIIYKDKCLYLKETNSYYTFVSDVSIGTFYPTEGEVKGNNLILKNARSTLILEFKDQKFIIKSFIEK